MFISLFGTESVGFESLRMIPNDWISLSAETVLW